MSKNKYWTLPDGQHGLEESATSTMVRQGFKLLKVFTEGMDPVINHKTGRQLVTFFNIADLKPWGHKS